MKEILRPHTKKKISLDVIQEGKRVLNLEAQAILRAAEHLGQNFKEATNYLMNCKGKVVVTGIGKSGQVGKKIASTLASTGTPSFFLHPSESSHGDLGILSQNDLLLAISQSGQSSELFPLLNFSARRGLVIVAMTGSLNSSLAKAAHLCIDTSVKKEACPFNMAPTSSSTLTLALGDALAMAILKLRGFKREDYAEFHPGGTLGKRLLFRIEDLMHSKDNFALVSPYEKIENILKTMTSKEIKGIAGVVNKEGSLIGVITDGDLRRFFMKTHHLTGQQAFQMMSKNPKTIDKNEPVEKALFLMEKLKIQSLFVVEKPSTKISSSSSSFERLIPLGLIHFQDFLQAGMK